MPIRHKYLSILGLAAKAGKVISGGMMTEKMIQNGRAVLVLAASDASENTKKKFTDLCRNYAVPLFFPEAREVLGHAVGKDFRASLAVTDQGFADAIIKELKSEEQGKCSGGVI